MPNINVPISDLLATVERPIIFDVIRQLQDRTGISSKTQIRYWGEDAKAQQWNSAIDTNKREHNLWPVVSNLTIEVEEDFNEDQLLGIVVKQPDVPFIFLDGDIDVYIKPVFSPQDVTIRFKYKARDRNDAIRWRNEFRTRLGMNRQIFLHTLQYSYLFPQAYMDLLNTIWTMKEAVAGNGLDFLTWFKRHATNKLTELSNINATSTVYAVAQSQVDVQGMFDVSGVPDKPEKDGELENWTITANYRFRYSKPINTVCYYPYMVHQQIVPKQYRFPNTEKNLLEMWTTSNQSGQAFSFFQADSQYLMRQANLGIAIPEFDDFQPGTIPSTTLRMFTALTNITVADKRTLLNLSELGDYSIHPDILTFLKSGEYSHLATSFNSIFLLQLYENENIVSDGILSVDSNLNVVATSDLDLTKRYHVRMSLCADMTYLTPMALARLQANPAVRDRIVAAINAALSNSGKQADLMKNHLLPVDYVLLGITEGNDILFGNSFIQILYIAADELKNYKPPVPPAPIAVRPIFSNDTIG